MECKEILRQNGTILVTTPNCSIYSSQLSWSVETPPVHLWWFNKTGIHTLAKKCNLKCSLLDGFSSPWVEDWKKISRRHFVEKYSTFNEQGELIHNKNMDRRIYRLGIIKQIKSWIEKKFYMQDDINPTIAAKLTFDNE